MVASNSRVAAPAPRTWDGSVSSDWHTSGNWVQNTVPSGADDVTIGVTNTAVTLSADTASVNSLSILNGGDLFTSGSRLTVDDGGLTGSTTISGSGTRIVVEPGDPTSDFNTDLLDVDTGGTLQLSGGIALVDIETTVAASGTILGFGVLETSQLNMNGRIEVGQGDLTVRGGPNAVLDLDGDLDSGTLDVVGGSLTIEAEGLNPFGGTMNVGSGNTLQIETDWKLDGGANGGELNLNGGASMATAAVLADGGGAEVATIEGNVNVSGFSRMTAKTLFGPSAAVSISTNTSMLVLVGDTEIQGGTFTGLGTLRIDGAATISSSAAFDVSLLVSTGASVDIDSGAVLELNDVEFTGGTFQGAGTLRQAGDALVSGDTTISTAVFDWDGSGQSLTTISEATFTLNSSAIQDPADGESYLGTTRILNGTLLVNTPNAWRLGGTLILEDQNLPVRPTVGGAADLVVDASGVLSGDGQILVNVDNGGLISPGASPGRMDFAGDLLQRSTSTLKIELAGAAPEQYDRIVVAGEAVLDGLLEIVLLDDFVPPVGSTYEVLVARDRRGAFATISGSVYAPDRVLWPRYSNSGLVLVSTFPGDTDGDGDVDLDDLNNVRNHFGESGTPVTGDTNGDHVVDLDDLNNVRNYFGAMAPQSPRSIPEPCSSTLLVQATLFVGALYKVRRVRARRLRENR